MHVAKQAMNDTHGIVLPSDFTSNTSITKVYLYTNSLYNRRSESKAL